MNKYEAIRSKYAGYYMTNVSPYHRWSKENINKYNDKESIDKHKKYIIEYAKTIESLESNIDKMLGLIL